MAGRTASNTSSDMMRKVRRSRPTPTTRPILPLCCGLAAKLCILARLPFAHAMPAELARGKAALGEDGVCPWMQRT